MFFLAVLSGYYILSRNDKLELFLNFYTAESHFENILYRGSFVS